MQRTFERVINGSMFVVTAEAWEDGDGNIAVIGTHDPEDAYTLWIDYLEDYSADFGADYVSITEKDFVDVAKLYVSWDSLFNSITDELVWFTKDQVSEEQISNMEVVPAIFIKAD